MTASQAAIDAATIVALAADEKLAERISVLDVSDRLAITDIFVIASADTERQVQAIVDEVELQMRDQLDRRPTRREGATENRWTLLDYGDLVVHVQRNEEREFYALDRLWKDCPAIAIEGIDAPALPAEWQDDTDLADITSVDELELVGEGPEDNLS